MFKFPRIAKEPRSFATRGEPVIADRDAEASKAGGRDLEISLGEPSLYGDLKRNMTAHSNVTER